MNNFSFNDPKVCDVMIATYKGQEFTPKNKLWSNLKFDEAIKYNSIDNLINIIQGLEKAENTKLNTLYMSARDKATELMMKDKSLSDEAEKENNLIPEEEEKPFPVEALPVSVQRMIKGMQRAFRLPVEMMGLVSLIAISTAIGNSVKLKYKNGYEVPASLWGVTVGASSIGKTPIYKHLFKPLRLKDKELLRDYKDSKAKYINDSEQYKLQKKEAAKEGKLPTDADGNTIQVPQQPVKKKTITTNSTLEGIFKVSSNNPKGVLIFSDEILGFVGGMSKYSNSNDENEYLGMWSGADISVSRSGSEDIDIENPFVSVTGGIQPGRLGRFMDGDRDVSGFVSRFLFAYPRNQKKQYDSGLDIDEYTTEKYKEFIHKVYALPCDVNDEGLIYTRLQIVGDAKDAFLSFNKKIVNLIRDTESDSLNSYFGKMETYCLRFALILEVSRMIENNLTINENHKISIESIESAIKLAEHYIQVGERVLNQINFYSPLDDIAENKRAFYMSLPDKPFATKLAYDKGSDQGMSISTVKRFLKTKGLFKIIGHGLYEKTYKNSPDSN